MRLLFSSSDITEIGRVGREFVQAGIPCGGRYEPAPEGKSANVANAELWVQSESDFYRAVVLYLRHKGIVGPAIPEASTVGQLSSLG